MTDLESAHTYAIGSHLVHRLGFGAMQLPGPGVLGPPKDHDAAIAVLRRAVELGVDHIDTAEFYGPHVSNELIKEALHPYPDNLVIVSKVGARRDAEGNWTPHLRPEHLREDVEENLRTLGTERLGAVNLRLNPEADEETRAIPLADQLGELVALRDEGKIDGVGISTATLDQVETAIETAGLVCVQNAFSLLDQSDLPVLNRCAEAGVAYVPYFPLGSAFPGTPKVTEAPVVVELAQEKGYSAAQIGLAWLLARSPNILLIPGTSSVSHLEENLAVLDVELGAADLERLETANTKN